MHRDFGLSHDNYFDIVPGISYNVKLKTSLPLDIIKKKLNWTSVYNATCVNCMQGDLHKKMLCQNLYDTASFHYFIVSVSSLK